MAIKRCLFFSICALCTLSLWGFDARYSPSEAGVSWRAPEGGTDKAASIFSQPSLGNVSLMTGEVAVNGDPERPFIAKLDSQGNVEWSKRLPLSVEKLYDNISIAEETHLMVAFQTLEDGVPVDRLGSFNPVDGFSAKFTKSLPALPVDPLNPFSGGRSFQIQRGGKVAIVELQGSAVNLLMLSSAGNPQFAQTYTLPAGDDSPFPIPGFGLSYDFIAVTELENGDFYLTTEGSDLLTQTVKAIVIRLSSSGSILWQRIVDIPGTTAFVSPRADEKVLISGNAFGESSVSSSVVLLDETGQSVFAKSVDGVSFNGFSFEFFANSGNILLQGSIIDTITQDGFTTDGGVLVLSNTGDKIGEAAYDLSDNDSIFHVGSINGNLYFELFGISASASEEIVTHGILARTDANLDNWVTRSYLDIVGPSALFSAFFTGAGSPFLTYRDADPSWINVSKLDADLQETGDCQVLVDKAVVPYDPNFTVTSFPPTVATSGVSATPWTATPTLTDAPFVLENTPLTVQFVCGSGADPVSLWDDVPAVNEQGDKNTEIGWINDSGYPYIWHYSAGGWIYIAADTSNAQLIYGYDYENGFWFVASNLWLGWYFNLENPGWGTAGWGLWD